MDVVEIWWTGQCKNESGNSDLRLMNPNKYEHLTF